MKSRIVVPFLAALALSAAAAAAQNAPPPPPADHMWGGHHMDMADMEKHRAQMCSDFTPRAIGKLAYLQAKLALTDIQKPLFERWKSVVLSSIKAHEGACMNAKLPGRDASVVDMARLRIKMMETHLADLKAQMPALEALTGALNAEQNKLMDRAAMHMMHERGDMMEHMRGMHDHMMGMHHEHDGDHDGDGPPPAN